MTHFNIGDKVIVLEGESSDSQLFKGQKGSILTLNKHSVTNKYCVTLDIEIAYHLSHGSKPSGIWVEELKSLVKQTPIVFGIVNFCNSHYNKE